MGFVATVFTDVVVADVCIELGVALAGAVLRDLVSDEKAEESHGVPL